MDCVCKEEFKAVKFKSSYDEAMLKLIVEQQKNDRVHRSFIKKDTRGAVVLNITKEGIDRANKRIELGIKTNDNARSLLPEFMASHFLG